MKAAPLNAEEEMNSTHCPAPDCDCFDCDVKYDRRIKETKAAAVLGLTVSTLQKRRCRGAEPFAEYDGRACRYRARYIKEYAQSRTRRSTSEHQTQLQNLALNARQRAVDG